MYALGNKCVCGSQTRMFQKMNVYLAHKHIIVTN